MEFEFTWKTCGLASYYSRLGVTRSATVKEIKTAFNEKYRDADAEDRTWLNKAKTCLTDEASRKAYDDACDKFDLKDG